MNRVWHLVHSSRNQRHQQSSRSNEIPSQPRFPDDADDQSTVVDQDDHLSDASTLNTALSEASTIGDLQRHGFVNRCPRFTHQRCMPFVSILLNKGFFCFPSEESYKVYLQNKRRLSNIDSTNESGIPLFHAVSPSVVKTMFSRKLPIMKIYRYTIQEQDETLKHVELVTPITGTTKCVYKYEFCIVFKDVLDHYHRVEHKLIFNNLTDHGMDSTTYSMINHMERRNSDTKLDGLNLRWYGTTGFASPFGSSHFKLLVLDDGMPSLMDQQSMEEYDAYTRTHPSRPLGHLPVWARYSDDKATMIPKRRTLRLADFEIGETESNNGSARNGLLNVPWKTLVLTCMAMVLHEYEARKDKRRSGTPADGIVLGSGLLL